MDSILKLFENHTVVAFLAFVVWFAVVGSYIIVSKRQQRIETDVESLHDLLKDEEVG